jgi:inward rectifier potassium channel
LKSFLKATKKTSIADDLGLGAKVTSDRNMNKDGTFNVRRIGESKFRFYEIYHQLITMPWLKFFAIIVSTYFTSNLIFATIYFAIGAEHLTGIDPNADNLHKFLEAFFFSSQTLTTVGFGRLAPLGTLTSAIAAIESMLGVLVFAIATGLLYGRFSRPQAKLLYSDHAIIAPYRQGTGLMFRMANMRHSQLIEVEVSITLSYIVKGAKTRSFDRLKLEREKVNLFPTNWTVVHPIDEESPFFNLSQQEFHEMRSELIILLKAFDDTFSQTVYSRTSYHTEEIIYGRKFLPMVSMDENGKSVIDLRLINAMEARALPAFSKMATD